MSLTPPETLRNIYKYTTEKGDSWNGYRLKVQRDGITHRQDFHLSNYNGSWWRCGRAVVKARKELYKNLNIL